jgi:hypothetical protein
MNKSVVAVFENRAAAERAREDLSAGGVPELCMSLHAGDLSPDTKPQAAPGTQIDTEHGIGHFFRSILGLEDDRPDRYEEAARRGHATLVIDCQNDEEVEQIRLILDRHDVIDIDERAAQWDAQSHRDRMRGEAVTAASSGGSSATGSGSATSSGATRETGRVRVYTRRR